MGAEIQRSKFINPAPSYIRVPHLDMYDRLGDPFDAKAWQNTRTNVIHYFALNYEPNTRRFTNQRV